ncbi:MAG: hypothetical protein DLM60_21825 [Pseudonocardiales bacterium]|nr:MAG: hypothetical protein DLM60_21825 [Pseudonocardiales bacterium]
MFEERLRLLVTVKAYPQPSRTYGETVCVAGVRVDTSVPSWIRLYPVAYRDLAFIDRFKKYQILDLRAFRSSSDQRPESYKPNISAIILGDTLGTGRGWRERWKHLNPFAGATTACELLARQGTPAAPSLGLIKPREVTTLDIEPNDTFSEDKQRLAELAAAGDLFTVERSVLEPAPYRLKYHYFCMDPGCKGHTQSLIDWEAGEAARNWKQSGYAERELPERLRRKFFDQMCATDRDTYFFLGNQHQHPKGFLVLGVFWPPAGSRPAPTLFD